MGLGAIALASLQNSSLAAAPANTPTNVLAPKAPPLPGRANTFCLNAVTLLRHLESAVGEFAKWILTTDEDVLLRGAPRQLELSPNDEQGVVQLALIKQWNDTT